MVVFWLVSRYGFIVALLHPVRPHEEQMGEQRWPGHVPATTNWYWWYEDEPRQPWAETRPRRAYTHTLSSIERHEWTASNLSDPWMNAMHACKIQMPLHCANIKFWRVFRHGHGLQESFQTCRAWWRPWRTPRRGLIFSSARLQLTGVPSRIVEYNEV